MRILTDSWPHVIVLPGLGGDAPEPAMLMTDLDDLPTIETIGYPGWRRYIENSFSAEVLITDLAAQVAARVPNGPITIVGISIGGHFAYAVALCLQASGRQIAGFGAIDAFMIDSAAPLPGWRGRALARGYDLLRRRCIAEFLRFVRARVWRALLRFAGVRLPRLLRGSASSGRLPAVFAFDPIFEKELNMRLLIQKSAFWVASLDWKPIALKAPATLVRTKFTECDDNAWRRRCPGIEITEIEGDHQTLSAAENTAPLKNALVTAVRNLSHS